MDKNKISSIKLFEEKLVHSVWDETMEKWYFSIRDVVELLTDAKNVDDYIKKLRKRDTELSAIWQQLTTPIITQTSKGRQKTNYSDTQGILRIIQSVPSKKAEPFKQWLAKVGSERIDQMVDPERSIGQALQDYKRLGYSDNWINQRLKTIEVRKDLTDEWDAHGIKNGQEYATLTDIIYQTWAGKTTREYKAYKGLKKENLRDNMTNEELVLNMLAELSTTSITRAKDPQDLEENANCAVAGANIAKDAREKLEQATKRKVISPLSAKDIPAKNLEN